jgi:hypothetical protein
VRGWLIILGKPLNKTDLKLHMVISSFSRPKMPIRLGPILYPWTTSVVQLPPQLNFHPPYRCFFFRSDDGLYCPFSSTLQNLRDGESQLGKDCGGKITSTWIDIHAFRCSWTYGRTSINIYILFQHMSDGFCLEGFVIESGSLKFDFFRRIHMYADCLVRNYFFQC